VKPSFVQLGPYRFREVRDKQDIKFNNRDSTVSYNPISSYFFDAEGSNGTLDDIILNVNIVAIGAAGQATHMTYKQKKIVSMGLNSYEEKFTVAKTARELLFEGYEDEMVLAGKEGMVQGFDPVDIPFDKIGWFYKVCMIF
jgi:scavenger receptor class B, member 1